MPMPTGNVPVGATDTYTATALDGNLSTVSGATVVTVSSDDTIVSVVSNGSTGGVETGTWTAIANGTATLTSSSNGVSSGTGNPGTITVAQPVDAVASVSLA